MSKPQDTQLCGLAFTCAGGLFVQTCRVRVLWTLHPGVPWTWGSQDMALVHCGSSQRYERLWRNSTASMSYRNLLGLREEMDGMWKGLDQWYMKRHVCQMNGSTCRVVWIVWIYECLVLRHLNLAMPGEIQLSIDRHSLSKGFFLLERLISAW